MKKLLMTLLLGCLLCCLALPLAAAQEEAAQAPATAPETLLDHVMLIALDAEDMLVMTEDDLYDLMGIEYDDYTDFAYLAAYDALTGRELIVIDAADEEAAERIAALLEEYLAQRLRETRNYLPEAYQVLSEAKVARAELRLVLSIAAPDEQEETLLLTLTKE